MTFYDRIRASLLALFIVASIAQGKGNELTGTDVLSCDSTSIQKDSFDYERVELQWNPVTKVLNFTTYDRHDLSFVLFDRPAENSLVQAVSQPIQKYEFSNALGEWKSFTREPILRHFDSREKNQKLGFRASLHIDKYRILKLFFISHKNSRTTHLDIPLNDCKKIPQSEATTSMEESTFDKAPILIKSSTDSFGSGFFFKESGKTYLVTASHVLKSKLPKSVTLLGLDEYTIQVTKENTSITYDNPDYDIVFLEIKDNIPDEIIFNSSKNNFTIGESLKVMSQYIPYSSNNYVLSDFDDNRISVFGTPGNGSSGAPIINQLGNVVGIYQNFELGGIFSSGLRMSKALEIFRAKAPSRSAWAENFDRNFGLQSDKYKYQVNGRIILAKDGGVSDAGDKLTTQLKYTRRMINELVVETDSRPVSSYLYLQEEIKEDPLTKTSSNGSEILLNVPSTEPNPFLPNLINQILSPNLNSSWYSELEEISEFNKNYSISRLRGSRLVAYPSVKVPGTFNGSFRITQNGNFEIRATGEGIGADFSQRVAQIINTGISIHLNPNGISASISIEHVVRETFESSSTGLIHLLTNSDKTKFLMIRLNPKNKSFTAVYYQNPIESSDVWIIQVH